MCQSLAQGGMRCISHTKTALQNSEDALVNLVIAESQKSGIELPAKATMFNPAEDGYKLDERLMANPQYKNAKIEKEIAETSYKNLRKRVTEAIAEDDHSALKDILYRGNPEARELLGERAMIMDAAEKKAKKANPLKRPFILAEGKKKAQWATDRLKAIKSRIDDEVNTQKRVQKNFGHSLIVHTPDLLSSVRSSMVAADGKKRELEHYDEKFRETYKNQIANDNMRKNPQYQEALNSSSVSSSEAYSKWKAKHEVIAQDYAVTNENISFLELQARVAGKDTPQGKAYLTQAKDLGKQRESKIRENKVLAIKQNKEKIAHEKAINAEFRKEHPGYEKVYVAGD